MKKYICTALLLCLQAACQSGSSYECLSDDDCTATALCVAGTCVSDDASDDIGDDSGSDTSDDVAPGDVNEDTDPGDVQPDPEPDIIDDTIGPDVDPGDVVDPDAGPVCGDGVVDDNEECDNGDENSDESSDTADACRTDCTLPFCGDGIRDFGEGCDRVSDDEPFGWHCNPSTCEVVLDTPCLNCVDRSDCPGFGNGPQAIGCVSNYCVAPCGQNGSCTFPTETVCNDPSMNGGFCELISDDFCIREVCEQSGDEDGNGLFDCDDPICADNRTCQELDCNNDDFESNDTYDSTTLVALADQALDAVICGLESDFYFVDFGTRRDPITFSLQFPTGADPAADLDVDVYSTDGNVIGEVNVGGEYFTIDQEDYPGGSVILAVFNYDRRMYPVPYRLAFYPDEGGECEPDIYEPNGTPPLAFPFWDESIDGAVLCPGDVDHYRLPGNRGATNPVLSLIADTQLRVTVQGNAGSVFEQVVGSDPVEIPDLGNEPYVISLRHVEPATVGTNYVLEVSY